MYRVVIIDDEPIIAVGLSKTIRWEKWNCRVVGIANDGIEGLEVIKREHPHIVITDIAMPHMDGLTMIAALKSQYEKIQISILSGYRDFDYAQQAIRLGVCRFVLKPSRMEEIEEAVEAMLKNLREMHVDSEAELIAAELEPEVETEAEDEDLEGLDGAASSFIVKNAVEYIEENYREKLKLSDVAEKVYVSQWHLSKLLNRYTDQNFSEILNGIRIEKAKKLLENPALRIGDIAEEVGFLDVAHFSRVFKRQVGISANEFRNKILGK